MKNIKPGEYWTVKYTNYTGIVLVIEECPREPGYSCILAKDLPKKWINHLSGSRFTRKEFRKKTTKKAFLLQRASYLLSQANKCKKEATKIGKALYSGEQPNKKKKKKR
jgi:hypothetical protein